MDVFSGVEPEVELLLAAADTVDIDVGVQRVRIAGGIALPRNSMSTSSWYSHGTSSGVSCNAIPFTRDETYLFTQGRP